MNNAALKPDTHDIVVDEVFPHAPETMWKALTTGELIGRWLMKPTGFEPVKGNRFTYQTKPGGAWDGVIHCQVLEVIANQRFVYAWTGGHEANAVGYGAPLDTVVTWTLSRVANGTQVRLVHSGFVRPRNDSALEVMGEGWRKVIGDLRNVAGADEGEEKMSGAYTGGCACGAIRYENADDPMVQSDCQCRDCQRKSGTGHTATSWVGRCLGTRRWACSTPCWLDAAQA